MPSMWTPVSLTAGLMSNHWLESTCAACRGSGPLGTEADKLSRARSWAQHYAAVHRQQAQQQRFAANASCHRGLKGCRGLACWVQYQFSARQHQPSPLAPDGRAQLRASCCMHRGEHLIPDNEVSDTAGRAPLPARGQQGREVGPGVQGSCRGGARHLPQRGVSQAAWILVLCWACSIAVSVCARGRPDFAPLSAARPAVRHAGAQHWMMT